MTKLIYKLVHLTNFGVFWDCNISQMPSGRAKRNQVRIIIFSDFKFSIFNSFLLFSFFYFILINFFKMMDELIYREGKEKPPLSYLITPFSFEIHMRMNRNLGHNF
jgi:hypothetical protein